jgi:multiple sugar transport system permease protein
MKYLLVTPLLIFVLFLIAFPAVYDIYLSVHDTSLENLQGTAKFIGLSNFVSTLKDPTFRHSLLFSLKFASVVTLIEVFVGLMLALYFYHFFKRHDWVMTFILIPMMIAPAILAIMFRLMLNEFIGIIPQYLRMLGLGNINLMGPHWIFTTLVVIESLQWTPFAFLITYAGLQGIPLEMFEAARVDGASSFQIFFRIMLPLLTPALVITSFIRFIDTFRIFDNIYVLTGGGPGDLTTSISIYIYRTAFKFGTLGKSVAASLFLLVLSLITLVIAMKFILRGSTGAETKISKKSKSMA